MRVSIRVLMHQGQHSLGRLFRGSELLHARKLCLACCYVTPRATPFAQTHPEKSPLIPLFGNPQSTMWRKETCHGRGHTGPYISGCQWFHGGQASLYCQRGGAV